MTGSSPITTADHFVAARMTSDWVAHGPVGDPLEILLYTVTADAAVAAVLVYLIGASRLRRYRAGRARLPRWRVAAFVSGVAVTMAVISPPVDHVVHELFAVHMAQHIALAFVAAPLLVLGCPLLVMSVALGRQLQAPWASGAWEARLAESTPFALALAVFHVVTWYVWHLPAVYQLALETTVVHVVEHSMLMLSGMALTWHAVSVRSALGGLAGASISMIGVAPLAALLVFASGAWYDGGLAEQHGLTALEDQQLGGALMWFPGSLAYLAAVTAIVLRRLGRFQGEAAATSRVPYMPLS